MNAIINNNDPSYLALWEALLDAEMPAEFSDDEVIVSLNEDDETEGWFRLS